MFFCSLTIEIFLTFNANNIKLTIYSFGECTVINGIVIKTSLTLYDPGGGGGALKAPPPPPPIFALTHLILELHYCAFVTFPKKLFNTVWQKKNFDWGS